MKVLTPELEPEAHTPPERRRIIVRGIVQGVGFRPFIYRLAAKLELVGWVRNSLLGVEIEIEGSSANVRAFQTQLVSGQMTSRIHEIRAELISLEQDRTFRILSSETEGVARLGIAPDLATCGDCLEELFSETDRRSRYAFINCTQCGPRYTILRAIPYDRPLTTMSEFELCSECRSEYENPSDRRFHAEPIACAECGPNLEWISSASINLFSHDPIDRVVECLRKGGVIALKGIGGFHLMAAAMNESAVVRVREIKQRDAKPLAVMYPNLGGIELDAGLTNTERDLLLSPAAPIVLLSRRSSSRLAPAIAPYHSTIGAMLPYSPIHHLILRSFGGPLVATSANSIEEPIIISNDEASALFDGKVDGLLVHNRNIARRADDSVMRVIAGKPRPIRIGRGFAPLTLTIPQELQRRDGEAILALGAHEKTSIALATEDSIRVSQHLGDLERLPSRRAYRDAVTDFLNLYRSRPSLIACDQHPDYFTSQLARELAEQYSCPLIRVQHHFAHLCSLLAEQEEERAKDEIIGFCWDGTGYGPDGTVWGGECLALTACSIEEYRRVGSLMPFPLPGGERCVKEPWRVALALLSTSGIDAASWPFDLDRNAKVPQRNQTNVVFQMLSCSRQVYTSSMGRLFDGVASLLGLRHYAQFSAQPAMDLEFLAGEQEANRNYDVPVLEQEGLFILDWRPMIREIASDIGCEIPRPQIAAAFHDALARSLIRIALALNAKTIALTGGCFQNRRLTESIVKGTQQAEIRALTHQRVPPNDGGIAPGQAFAGLLNLKKLAQKG